MKSLHLSTRQYARIVARSAKSIDLYPAAYGMHTMRRTKATLVYRRTCGKEITGKNVLRSQPIYSCISVTLQTRGTADSMKRRTGCCDGVY